MRYKKKWDVLESPSDNEIKHLAEELGSSEVFAKLCLQRGLKEKNEVQDLIEPNPDKFYDPFLMYDMEKAVERIREAIIEGEKITIYGDYDADGITSVTLLMETLMSLGAECDYYIPNRFEEGYGPNKEAFHKIKDNGTTLIITCDNGIQGHKEIKDIQEHGVDVIVTDHHQMSETLPEAYAVIHPKHPEGSYPFGNLAGVGVALKLAAGLLEEIPYEYFDLAAIGTVCDLVELKDENRFIVQVGLEYLSKTQRTGLLSLYEIAGVRIDSIDEGTIGFLIGPRLNSAGRMKDATLGVELLLSFDQATADEIAHELDRLNNERKQLVEKITEEAEKQIDPDDAVHIIAKEGWHEGVIGIVASRLVENTGRPVLAFSIDENNQYAKGSGRSIEVYNLYQALNNESELLEQFGGHEMAAGLTIKTANLDLLKEKMNEKVKNDFEKEEFIGTLNIDMELSISDVSPELIAEIEKLAPYGTGHQQPLFAFYDVIGKSWRKIGADQTHLKGQLEKDNTQVEMIAFREGNLLDRLGVEPVVNVAGKLELNEWNGRVNAQINVEEIDTTHTQVIDSRSRHIPDSIWKLEGTEYIFFTEKMYHKAQNKFPDLTSLYFLKNREEAAAFRSKSQKLVFVDCPVYSDSVLLTLENNNIETIYAVFYSFDDAYFQGLPKREEFVRLYKYIQTHSSLDLAGKTKDLAQYLKFDPRQLIFMLKVFQEAKFVTIENGVLSPISSPKQVEIKNLESIQRRKEKMKTEEKLLYSSISELTDFLTN